MGKRPYFIWDYDISEDQIPQILQGGDEQQKVWLIGRILQYARWEDIWKYLTLDMVRQYFDRIAWRFPETKEMWRYSLELWGKSQELPLSAGEAPATYLLGQEPCLSAGILTPLQQEFLARFFAIPAGRYFYLTGDTALAAFYLHHRISLDLDLFTQDKTALNAIVSPLLDIAAQIGGRLRLQRQSDYYLQAVLEREEIPVRVDLVCDVGPLFGEKRLCAGIVVDSLENIAVNKVTALLSRTESKDFVDLYFILQAGFRLEDLIRQAKQKDMGLTEFFLAHMMRRVTQVSPPQMLKPLSWGNLASILPGAGRQSLTPSPHLDSQWYV